ncbi:MAG: terpene cyclase/mutase family protein [Chitinophagales bacterium]|nr:terpene cyclase/mutase family protein [Chitinophagales bacterium]MDW8418100.1 terpene cyclase/mutase family protein [Chitinophagales bacterium]
MEQPRPLLRFCSRQDGTQYWEVDPHAVAGELDAYLGRFSFDRKQCPNATDALYRSLAAGNFIPSGQTPLERGWEHFSAVQTEGGHWPGDYGGPMFLLPGLVIAAYVTRSPFSPAEQHLIKRYMLNHQQDDGGWGLHIEGPSTMFGTVMQYVSLRLLGERADAPHMTRAREWILAHGGATATPSWGKFYLAVLGAYEWEGCNSLFPEMWLLPHSLPVHPWRYWCHARMVYLPMAYCFGNRVRGEITPLITEIQSEIYPLPYRDINWTAARDHCAATDLYHHPSLILKILNIFLNLYEKWPVPAWRRRALDFILQYVNAEDDHTQYIDIGPVNQVINSLCVWHAYGSESQPFKKHRERWKEYLWIGEDGMKMQGYNGSQLWDTAFAFQALMESPVAEKFTATAAKALGYIDRTQVREEVRDHKKFYRHDSVGGWPFSTAPHGWPITDCTAEGLKSMLTAIAHGMADKHTLEPRLRASCDLLLSFQNKDGGWASYELTRAPEWLELLNPSEVFGNIMIDYTYTECSSAALQALMHFNKTYPDYRSAAITGAVERGIRFILGKQQSDGGWYGSWAVCFTYGTWFACEALSAYLRWGGTAQRDACLASLRKAADFLLSRRLSDGGWGESYKSCVYKKYVPAARSQAVNTAWAALSLMRIYTHVPEPQIADAVHTAVAFLEGEQQANGDFRQEHINGVFNHNCMITYINYRNIFPLWALGRYAAMRETLAK